MAPIVLAVAIFGKFTGAYLGAPGLRLGILDTNSYTIIVLVAVVTSVMAPPLLRMAMKRVEYTEEEQLRLSDRAEADTRGKDVSGWRHGTSDGDGSPQPYGACRSRGGPR
ncbi:hypothetical protein [Streptomyces sp. NPDC002994]|uniref:hypothetical protein n=1 Tax=Streptomyces sp. NPDC002994 TaxID=3154441 RepID=UPI0033B42AE7